MKRIDWKKVQRAAEVVVIVAGILGGVRK